MMKNFHYYEYTPREKKEIEKIVYVSHGFDEKSFKSLSALMKEKERLDKIVDKAYKNDLEKKKRLEEEFKHDLFEKLNILDNPKKELLYKKACQHGEIYGKSEIFNVACDLVELIK